MFSKLNSLALFFALWFGFVALFVSASPVPILHAGFEDIALSEDLVAREPIAIDAVKRDDLATLELTDAEEVDKRDPVANPEEDVDVEARICRWNCL